MAKPSGRRRIRKLLMPHFVVAAGFTLALNILFLVSPIYMLQIYDRVLTTGSIDTLIVLTGVAVFLLVVFLFAEAGRRQVFARAAELLNYEIAAETLEVGFRDTKRSPTEMLQAANNLTRVQQSLHQGLLAPVFDLPFVLGFLAIMLFVHPALFAIGFFGASTLVLLAFLTERLTKEPLAEATQTDQVADLELRQLVRQRGAVAGMGMGQRVVQRWFGLRTKGTAQSLEAGTPATFLGAMTRSVRMILQVAVLGGGALFALRGDISPGAIIASSIILGRALAPIDQTVNAWRQMIGARRAFVELCDWIDPEPPKVPRQSTSMPTPEPELVLDELEVGYPGGERPLIKTIEHKFGRGRLVALLGSSGSGKTSLLQTISGAWPPHSGVVRLGPQPLASWDAEDRGQHIGYLPQHVELLRGTIRQNIARFTETSEDRVLEAARLVGCHDVIRSLGGYDVEIGEGGHVLSAGQRQAIGLARAFFGNPPLIVLDEPTAHLDSSLIDSLMNLFAKNAALEPEERSFTAIVATHDMRLLEAMDDVMMLKDRVAYVTETKGYVSQVLSNRPSVQQKKGSSLPSDALTVDIRRRPKSD